MATVRLYKDEIEAGEVPPVCMRCAEPATIVKPKRSFWGPDWVMALLVIGLLASGPLFLVALLLVPFALRQMRVPVPLCDRHRNHWLPLQVVLFGGLTVFALLLCSTIVLFVLAEGAGDPRRDLAGWFAFATILFLVLLIFPAAILHTRVIRPVEITNEYIGLGKVAKGFATAVKAERRKDW